MAEFCLTIRGNNEEVAAKACGTDEVRLVYTKEYAEGDEIHLESDTDGIFLVLQLDDAVGESFVYLKGREMSFEVPFGEKKVCYSPKSFSGNRHLLTARLARPEEIGCRKNLCENKYDRHGAVSCYPHASANVETRGESVFAAKNAINGNCENHSHGEWPYESWGINRDDNAKMRVEFGRTVEIDELLLYTRADFPHDNWWEQITVTFSDGSSLVWKLVKTDKAQKIKTEKKKVEWLAVGELIKSEDPSPFPALTQLMAFGVEGGK